MPTISFYTETELLQEIAAGNERAFRQLVNQYADLLAAHIYPITRSREQTEEIVQDIFLKIWQTREGLADVRSIRTWLYVISRNQAISALRKLIRESDNQKEYQRMVKGKGPDEDLPEREAQLCLVEKAIEQLPEQQKTAWILSRREGLKYKEIAIRMGLATDTVKKHIQYASISITRYVESHVGLLLLGILLEKSATTLPLL